MKTRHRHMHAGGRAAGARHGDIDQSCPHLWQPGPGITELSPDYLISSTGSRHEAMRPPLPFIFLAYVSCAVYSTEVNIHGGDVSV